ncbi:MAG: toxin-antitoxin system [Planctomyces sp.]|jgi:plasmid stability protein|nr:toxin-antitoxin system [Planctomyces sp.]
MAQFVVRNLEDDVRDKLRELARSQGRSMEETIRDILRNAVLQRKEPQKGLGTRLAKRFAKHGLTDPLPELPRQSFEPIGFDQ